jgi:hypothetical protein
VPAPWPATERLICSGPGFPLLRSAREGGRADGRADEGGGLDYVHDRRDVLDEQAIAGLRFAQRLLGVTTSLAFGAHRFVLARHSSLRKAPRRFASFGMSKASVDKAPVGVTAHAYHEFMMRQTQRKGDIAFAQAIATFTRWDMTWRCR